MDTNGLEFNEEVNLLRSPPNFEFAENHRKAQIIHKEVIKNSKRCPCCNQPIQNINYSLSTDIKIFMAHGTAYKYFLMIQIQYILLTINFIVAGIYNLIQNQKGYQCLNNETCKKTLNNYLSILNRMESDFFQDNILDSLYLVSIFIQLAFIRYISYSESDYYNLDHEIDGELAIKCCSMEILLLPNDCSKKQLMNYFINLQSERERLQFNVIDCCLIYDEEHLEIQLKAKIKEIFAQNNDISLKDVIRTTVDQIFILRNRELFLKFTGRVFITLCNEKEAVTFKNIIRRNSLVIDSPRPSDITWRKKKSFTQINLKMVFLKILIASALWIPLLKITQTKNEYIQANSGKSGYQALINILISVSVAVISFIIIKIMFHFHLHFYKDIQDMLYNKLLLIFLAHFELILNLIYYILAPINSINQQDLKERKQPIWCAGGLSEDIISIILTNSIIPIILSVIDDEYAWQLLQITYYKYFNTNSTLTQFEANQKVQKKINFNIKNIQTNILIHLCFYYGYIFPICYPVTLIALLIIVYFHQISLFSENYNYLFINNIYWIDKYQLINYGIKEDLKLEFYAFKFYIYFSIILQICSTQIIHALLKVYIYARYQLYISIFLWILLSALFFLTNLFFKKEVKQDQTTEALMKSLEHNDSYSKYNPLIDETLWLNEDYEEEDEQIVEGLHLYRFSRQAKFYDALKVKLLKELEKEFKQNSVSTARIQPLQIETI